VTSCELDASRSRSYVGGVVDPTADREGTPVARRPNTAPTVQTVLGTLTHRAILSPFSKPWFRSVPQGTWCGGNAFDLSAEIAASTSRVVSAISALVPPAGRSIRHSAIEHAKHTFDVGGYVWSGPVADFLALTPSEKAQVLRQLPALADRARVAIVQDAQQSGWLWMVSESPMYTMKYGRPRQQRPDLIILTRHTAEVVDLKTGLPSPADRKALAFYAAYHPLVISAGLPVNRWFLHAAASPSQDAWIPG
jgi:hypothetical protein